ncbi:MAG: hypothetical protein ACXWZX_18695 [Mycobacterium sp.]
MKPRLPILASGAFGAALAALCGVAVAAPCAGFNDVDTSSGFCSNVEWIKNRKVTLGCTSTTTYCPNDSVSRLQMAAFMNRLGTALTPVVVRLDATSGAVDLDLSPVVCQSAVQNIVDFPRRALVDATFSGTAAAGVDVAMRVVWSADGGGSWQPLSTAQSVTYVPAAQWSSASDLGTLDLAVGGTARFGVQISRNGAGGTDLTDSRCQVRATIGSRDGTATPF